jgi:hypothetical protein
MHVINGSSLAASQDNQVKVYFRVRANAIQGSEKPEKTEKPDHENRHHDRVKSDHGSERATQIFRQEINQSLKIAFRSAMSLSLNPASAYQSSESPEDLATDVLRTAREIATKSPDKPEKTLVRVRQSVEQAITASQTIVNTEEGASALTAADDLISRGLDTLASDTSLKSASALSIESTSKQRSSIQIRTQEGDIIKFDLRHVEKMSASDISLQTESGSATSTEISISSRSRVVLKIEGDINSAELEAIRSVFAQAEQLAEEFFSGDLNAALEIVAGLEFDSSQLARVSMKFRSSERISAQQTVLQSSPAPAAIAEDTVTAVPSTPAAIAEDTPAAAPSTPTAIAATTPTKAQPEPVLGAPVSTEVQPETVPPEEAVSSGGFLSGFSTLADFLGKIADFLEQGTGQIGGALFSATDARIRFEFTESFRLEILKAVMIEVAPETEKDDDPDGSVPKVLDGE